MSSRRKSARDFYLRALGRVPHAAAITALVEEIDAAEKRGMAVAFAILRDPSLDFEVELAKGRSIPLRDHLPQPAEDVADHRGAVIPGGR